LPPTMPASPTRPPVVPCVLGGDAGAVQHGIGQAVQV
jgi:hypothetical protein